MAEIDEGRLVKLLGEVNHQLHDEYHRQWDEAEEGVKTLAADAKHHNDGRLAKLLDIMFPGQMVTVTGESGKTLFSAEEHEKEEEAEDEEGEGDGEGREAA